MENLKDKSESLCQEQCRQCRLGTSPLERSKCQTFKQQLNQNWEIKDNYRLKRNFKFRNFSDALEFVNKIGEIAEEQGHHPDILLKWGKVEVTLWTHKVRGLTKSDFIMAAKIDLL